MNEKQFETKALELRQKFDGLMVVDDDSAKAMEVYETAAYDSIKALKEHMKVAIDDAHQKHKKLVATLKRLTAPFDEVRSGARSKRIKYQQEQERIAAEKQAELERQAQKKRDKEIRAAKAFDDTPKVEVLETEPVYVPPVKPSIASKVKGARTLWHAEVTDIKALARGVASGALSGDLIMGDMTVLNSMAVAEKDKLNIPGVKAVSRVV